MIKKILTLSALALSMSVMAQTGLGNNLQYNPNLPTVENSNGYLTDSSGKVVRSGFGLCWRTSSYDPAYTYMRECDGDRTPPAVAQAPDVVAPAPDIRPEPRPQPVVQNEIKTVILFDFDSSRISPQERVKLDSIINPNAKYQLTVTGHADPIGSDLYNRRLSERRAQAVYKYLRDNGIASENIELFAAGETRPVVECGTTQTRANITCNAPNRRVEIITK